MILHYLVLHEEMYCNSFFAYFFLAAISAVQYYAQCICSVKWLYKRDTFSSTEYRFPYLKTSYISGRIFRHKVILGKKKRITSHTSKKKVTIISFYLKCTWGQIAFTSSYKWTHKDVLRHFDGILQNLLYFTTEKYLYSWCIQRKMILIP